MKIYPILIASLFSLSVFCDVACADDVTGLISGSEASGAKAANEASGLIDNFRKYAAQQSGSAGKTVDSLNNGNGSIYRNGRGVSQNQGSAPSGSRTLPLASARKYPKQEALKDVPLPHKGKGKCKDMASQGSGKCPSTLFEGMDAKQAATSLVNTQLLIFVSQSVPADSIKELWSQAQKVGGKLVFRGLVGGSFKETQNHT